MESMPRHFTIKATGPFTLSENLNNDRSKCWRLLSAPARMERSTPIEVNGQFSLHEMAWFLEIYESAKPEDAAGVGYDFAQVLFQKDVSGSPFAVLLAHFRGKSFERLYRDSLAVPGFSLTLHPTVHGISQDADRAVDRWLTSKAARLEITDLSLNIGSNLAQVGA